MPRFDIDGDEKAALVDATAFRCRRASSGYAESWLRLGIDSAPGDALMPYRCCRPSAAGADVEAEVARRPSVGRVGKRPSNGTPGPVTPDAAIDRQRGYLHGRELATDFRHPETVAPYNPDFAQFARSCGVEGVRVKTAITSGKPYLIDANIGADLNPGGAGVRELPGLGRSRPLIGGRYEP
jgi:hypothetical protein